MIAIDIFVMRFLVSSLIVFIRMPELIIGEIFYPDWVGWKRWAAIIGGLSFEVTWMWMLFYLINKYMGGV